MEAILFLENEPLNNSQLIKKTGLSDKELEKIINKIFELYEDSKHGITLMKTIDGYQFGPKKNISKRLAKVYKPKMKKLTQSAMTTLSIIAYKQPVTKAELEDIKGVNVDSSVASLLERNLIKIVGRRETVGKPLEFGTTNYFLRVFNIKSLAEMPKLEEINSTEFK